MRVIRTLIVAILTWEARLVLFRYKPKIIAITGSVGKTTTKDAIFAVLSGSVYVRKSEKSFNSEIGVPLTILGLESAWRNPLRWALNLAHGFLRCMVRHSYPQWLVLEVGADRPGDIRSISRWISPDIAVITGVPDIPVHVEFFESKDALMREKYSLVEHIRPGGTLVINGDDIPMRALCADGKVPMITYGFGDGNDVVGSREEIVYEDNHPLGMKFLAETESRSVDISVRGALGRPRLYAALAALAVGRIVGVDDSIISRQLEEWVPPPGRMRIVKGIKETTIIDDTYNSSPAAALSALDTFQAIQIPNGGKKIAVLGDMLELGKFSSEAHRNVGARAALCADRLITYGFRARAIAEAVLDSGMADVYVRSYDHNDIVRLIAELKRELVAHDIILVKGSQSMRMERIVESLMAEPLAAKDFLARQDGEWKKR